MTILHVPNEFEFLQGQSLLQSSKKIATFQRDVYLFIHIILLTICILEIVCICQILSPNRLLKVEVFHQMQTIQPSNLIKKIIEKYRVKIQMSYIKQFKDLLIGQIL